MVPDRPRLTRLRALAARALAGGLILLALGAVGAHAQDSGAATDRAPAAWTNPVVSADLPDPSATNVDGVYWATGTSTATAPGFPLLRSGDLTHWEAVGSVFSGPPAWASDSLWSPELVADEAGIHVYYTARRRGARLCVGVASAPAPAGPYTDHGPLVCNRAGSIDPSVVHDAQRRAFLIWKEDGNAIRRPSRIWIRQLRPDGLGLVGRRREMIRNEHPWEGAVVEGPRIVARGSWLYMFYSGNTYGPAGSCDYALGVARSRSIFGPWRRNPSNPILASNNAWHCPGHASPVTDVRGRLFLLYHAYPAADGPTATRRALLDLVTWTRSGWPVVNDGNGPSSSAHAP